MYKFLLANRYLRTRFIALASIISVTLGVATMIVVNSVMSGFSHQMKDRIHGILADLMVESTSMDGTENPQAVIDEVNRIAGDYIEAITPTMEIYGMMSFDFAGQTIYRPVTLIGIVPEGKDAVSPMRQYMQSRMPLELNGELIREPLRSMEEPLDWSLTEQATEVRKQWVEWNSLKSAFQEHHRREANAGHTMAQTGQDQEIVQISNIEPVASEPQAFQDPFANSEPVEPIDPTLPLSGRVIIGKGLVSYQSKDPQTGDVTTRYFTQPGYDVNFTTISAGVPEPVSFPATVVDFFDSGMSEYDSNLVFCNLEELQQVRGMMAPPDPTQPELDRNWKNGSITTLQIKLKDYAQAPEVVRRLQTQLPEHMRFQVNTWEQKQGTLMDAVEMEASILNVLLFLIIMVAGFGILATFYMIVVEKTRDIGIMKSLGATARGIMAIFLSYGLALGLVGSGVGVVIGLLFVTYINQIEGVLSSIRGKKVFEEEIYFFTEIPTNIEPLTVIWVALGAISIAVLASVLPAYHASRMHPVEALRSQ